MLDIKFLRQNLDFVRTRIAERGQDIDLDAFVRLDGKRRDILQEVEALRNERNAVSKQVGEKKKRKEDSQDLISRMGEVSARIRELEDALKGTEEHLQNLLMTIPNIPLRSAGREKVILKFQDRKAGEKERRD